MLFLLNYRMMSSSSLKHDVIFFWTLLFMERMGLLQMRFGVVYLYLQYHPHNLRVESLLHSSFTILPA